MTDPSAELRAWLKSAPFELKRGLVGEIKTQADRLAAAIKDAAPVDSGATRDSIKVRRTRDSLKLHVVAGGDTTTRELRVGSGVPYDYVRALEFGTTKMAAHPFFYNTARKLEPEINRAIKDAVAKQIAFKRTIAK